ncbi:peroxidase 41 [Selaginella moellendorffii]|nr:peroxidase 41 [Selaginella moellendorffii]|eukprot:XP_002972219.2 peroxidase 41 [Selaginella moellendorffii]
MDAARLLHLFLVMLLVLHEAAQSATGVQLQNQTQNRQQQQQFLSVDYYKRTCPDVEKIVHQVMVQKFREAPVAAAGTLRIFFHDCMVQGCDASVLVASTSHNKAEKDFDINLSLPGDGFDAVMRAKQAVENRCPRTVSCADILAIASRDLIGMIGGPFWPVKKGRKDSYTSHAARVPGNLPSSKNTVSELMHLFSSKGFTTEEMVALAGAHTAGFAHCKEFNDRIYNWKNTSRIDPTMNPLYAANLRLACPRNVDPTIVANLDVTTSKKFDNVYYQNLQKGLGLLSTDQALFNDPRTKPLVNRFAASQERFFAAFASAMQKLGSIGVKSASQGNIRINCAAFNQ